MKNRVFFFAITLLALSAFSCSNHETNESAPSDIIDLRADTEGKPGYIVLRWSTPDDNTIRYVKVTYYDYLLEKDETRLASIYADSVLIPDTRQKFGEYTFNVQTVSSSGEVGTLQTITAISEPAAKQIALTGESTKIELKGDQMFTDSDDGSNVVANLVDGNISTIYHGNWAASTPLPHYIVVELKKEVNAFVFSYTTRNHANKDHPKVVNLYGSSEFDGVTYDVSKAKLLSSIKSGLPEGGNETYTSGSIIGNHSFKYIWFEVKETVSGNSWYALSEFSVSELGTTVYDPEAPDAK